LVQHPSSETTINPEPHAHVSADEVRERTSDPDYLETFARGLQVMLAMGEGGGSISDLARATGLPRPTVRRVLYTLTKLGYAREEGRIFELTASVTRFATAFLGTAGQSRMLQGLCESLASDVGEIATVAVLDGDDQLHVAFGVPPNFVGIALGVGSRLPSYLTAGGRVIWAHKSDAQIDAFLERAAVVARTERTLTNKAQIKKAILEARASGFCVADAEYSAEFKAVAFPVYSAGSRLFGALTINARKGPMLTDERFDRIVERCRVEAATLGRMISH
jgi:IclR family transcriptional regulator, pca regulon regulatory protein